MAICTLDFVCDLHCLLFSGCLKNENPLKCRFSIIYSTTRKQYGTGIYPPRFERVERQNLFTGWRDVKLSEQGIAEAQEAGRKIKAAGYEFDLAFTSVLTRAIKTCNIVLEESDQLWVPQIKTWRLNERHYGQLQGLDKTNRRKIWR